MSFPAFAQSILPPAVPRFRYSICTMVSDLTEYNEMVRSFVSAGFDPSFCEFLFCDNRSANQRDAYEAYNLFLASAQGELIILCHQDVRLDFDHIDVLDGAIRDMDGRDKTWALLGNAGGIAPGKIAVHITGRDGKMVDTGSFPLKAQSLDENFIVAKRSANLNLSHDLEGFHLYGTDLCQIAAFRGLTAYVIDFHLWHKGRGIFGPSFRKSYRAMSKKYRSSHRNGSIQTLGALLPTGRSRWQVQKALFLQCQRRQKLQQNQSQVKEGVDRIKRILGRPTYLLHFVLYTFISPLVQGLKDWGRLQPIRSLTRSVKKKLPKLR